jgi:hypothetical protein
MILFYVVSPCSLIVGNQRFWGCVASSSGLSFMFKEIYPLHCYPLGEVSGEKQPRNSWSLFIRRENFELHLFCVFHWETPLQIFVHSLWTVYILGSHFPEIPGSQMGNHFGWK